MASDCEQLFKITSPFSEEDLKTAYRSLAIQHHPDKFQDPEAIDKATEIFIKIQICLEELKLITVASSSGAQPSAKFTSRGEWDSFSEYIETIKNDTRFGFIWDTHIDGIVPTFQNLSYPLSPLLKNRIPLDLYTHQAISIDHFRQGRNVVLSTPTASGKSLAYIIPFLEQVEKDPNSTAIFLFPMKALANDQYANFERFAQGLATQAVFDGDTDKERKEEILSNPPNVLFTNPDELHHSILFTHRKWINFFKNLKLIVIDEIHIYKGNFGSHVANILSRLLHVVKLAGGDPQIVCTSATVSDPLPFTQALTGRSFHLVDKSGSGSAEKHIVFAQPKYEDGVPAVTPPVLAVQEAINFAEKGHQVIVFASSRPEVDILADYTKRLLKEKMGPQPTAADKNNKLPALLTPDQIASGYHAGYSSKMRRDVEARIKNGQIKIVFSTNALELGIDIGTLDVCILLGIPPTNNEIWQRIGRAGRKHTEPALVLMVDTGTAFDYYHFTNPEKFIATRINPDRPIIDPMNSEIRKLHHNCAYFEGMKERDVSDKTNWKAIDKKINKWWAYHRIEIRGGNPNPYVLLDVTGQKIGEIEYDRVYRDLYPGAIYNIDNDPYKYLKRDYKKRSVTLEKLLMSEEFTIPTIDVDVRIDGKKAVENLLQYGKRQVVFGHGAMEIDRLVTGYTAYYKIDPDMKQFRLIKYPDKWPTQKVVGFWLTIPPGVQKSWDKLFKDFPDIGAYGMYTFLHTLEHVLIREVREKGFCDWSDLAGASSEGDAYCDSPALIIYETQRKGIGLSEAIFNSIESLLGAALNRLQNCPCEDGCPACIMTPPYCIEHHGFISKELTVSVLEELLTSTSVRTSFDRGGANTFPPVPRGKYKEGDECFPGWIVIDVLDTGIICTNQSGQVRLHLFGDIPK